MNRTKTVWLLLDSLLFFVISQAQVKVWLGDHADHYYVLSRFLLSRTLTVTKVSSLRFTLSILILLLMHYFLIRITIWPAIAVKWKNCWYSIVVNNVFVVTLMFQIPNHVAIKIALELKKLLIDNSLLDVYAFSILLFPLLFN